MVKIPELPGNYRPGDVVNGHILTERGHWVLVAEGTARGTRPRRYLDTQVSTIRDPNTPTRELRGRDRASVYEITSVPPQPTFSGPTTDPRRTRPAAAPAQPGPAPLPRVRATPSTAAPAQQYSGSQYSPQARTGPTAPPPPTATRTATRTASSDNPYAARVGAQPRPGTAPKRNNTVSRLIVGAVVVFILIRVLSAIAENVDLSQDGFPWEQDTTATEFPSAQETWVSDDGEPMGTEVVNAEWYGQADKRFLVDLAVPDFEESLWVELRVEAFDADDEFLGAGSTWVYIGGAGQVRAVDYLDVDSDADIARIETVLNASPGDEAGSIEVLDWAVDESSIPVAIEVRTEVSQELDLAYGFIHAVVRDADGVIVGDGSESVSDLSAGSAFDTTIMLWDLEELPEDYTVEVTATTY